MSTQLATQKYRLEQWTGIIHSRIESGQTVKEFCSQNGISETQYFYWLRRVRAAAIEAAGSQFAELTEPVEAAQATTNTPDVTIELNGVRIHVNSNAHRSTLSMVMEVLSNA